jgi:hypothetical protein
MATRQFFTPRNTELAQSEVGIFMTDEDPYGVGAISTGKGDLGGKSYGTFQMPSNPSSPGEKSKAQLFVETGIPENYQQYFKDDKGQFHKAGTPGFDAAWKSLERFANKGFGEAQQGYIYKGDEKNVGLDKYLTGFKSTTGRGIDEYGDKARNIIEGGYNQYGGLHHSHVKHAVAERDAAIKNKKTFTEDDFMRSLINSKLGKVEVNFKSSPKVWKGVRNRFTGELAKFPVTAAPAETPGRKATRTAPAPAPAPAPVRKAKRSIPFLQRVADRLGG